MLQVRLLLPTLINKQLENSITTQFFLNILDETDFNFEYVAALREDSSHSVDVKTIIDINSKIVFHMSGTCNSFSKFTIITDFFIFYKKIYNPNPNFNNIPACRILKITNVTGKNKKIQLTIDLRSSQIYMVFCKNENIEPTLTCSLGILLKLYGFSKNSRRNLFGLNLLLKVLKVKIKKLLHKKYVFTLCIVGHKKNTKFLINFFFEVIGTKNIIFFMWKPSISFAGIKLKKTSAIKKRLKKRLLLKD